jgi:threonylcarbamoyladenosine tRNA methylthiotransferase MtaB
MHSFKIYSLGCKVNQYDGDKLGGLLKSAGFILAKKNANVAIVNSCAVTAGAIAKNRAMIKKAKKENQGAKIILTGCWPRVYAQEADEAGADIVWKKEKFSELIKKIKNIPNTKYKNAVSGNDNLTILKDNQNRSRYFLKVQDGCEQFCSYCIIPFARGKLRSRPMAEIIAEAEAAAASGYREIILSGIHLGFFGINNVGNIPTPSRSARSGQGGASHPLPACRQAGQEGNLKSANLLELLKRLVKIKNLERIRLSSIEVTEVDDELINFMAGEKKMCRHLHIPLQSGCDKILRLMKRPYDLKYFSAKIKKIREKMPEIAVSTDVIVDFPGENAKDFFAIEKFIKQIKFSRLHVFPFSLHRRTAAVKLPGRVGDGEIKKRAYHLRKLGEKLAADYQKKFKGKILAVAVERNRSSRTGKSKGRKMKGKTEYYFDVYFDKKDIISAGGYQGGLIGKIIKIRA